MGRVDKTPDETPKTFRHFSHPHELERISHNPNNNPPICSACKLKNTTNNGLIYTCQPCNFTLHYSCTKFPKLITHPSHYCTLHLRPIAAYPGGQFNCNACGRPGDGFSYHCDQCEYDLHVICAKKPLKFTNQAHVCPLELTFVTPYGDAKGFSCDICHKFGTKQWLYRCNKCEFDVHLDCTNQIPVQKPVLIQHHNSFPGAISSSSCSAYNHQIESSVVPGIPTRPNQLMHSASTGGLFMQNQFQPGGSEQVNGLITPPNQLTYSASLGTGFAKPVMQNNSVNPAGLGNGFMTPNVNNNAMQNAQMGIMAPNNYAMQNNQLGIMGHNNYALQSNQQGILGSNNYMMQSNQQGIMGMQSNQQGIMGHNHYAMQSNQQGIMGHNNYAMQGNQPGLMMPNNNNMMMNNQPSLGQTLMVAAMSGLVEGAFQQIGQTAMEGVIGDGGNAGFDAGFDASSC